ncbi:tetratricopeptide repeat protein [bacterium]|nr:tetratricopeptide repeat protein [bacterium]
MQEEREKLLRFAYIYFKKGDYYSALSSCEKCLLNYPDDIDALELMGDIKMELARWKEARDCYERALKLEPSRREIKRKLEKVERNLKEADELLKEMQQPGDGYTIGRTSIGIAENIEGFLCYLLPAIFPILVLLLEKESKFARFHAIQSLLLSAVLYILRLPLGIILNLFQALRGASSSSIVLYVLNTLVGGIIFLIWAWLAFGALKGKRNKLPWLGDLAEKWANL